MPSPAIATQPEPDSAANLDFYRTGDDFNRDYQAVTEEEKLIVTQIARSWQHLQDVYEKTGVRGARLPHSSIFTVVLDSDTVSP